MIESVRTPEPRVQGQGTESDLASRPATKEQSATMESPPATSSSLVPTTTSNESHTRSDELPARPDSQLNEFHIRFNELLARSRFATHGRDQKKKTEEKNSTALRYHVCRVSALCPVRNFRSRSNQTVGCAHAWMSGRAYESSLSMSRQVNSLVATSAVLWQCGWSGTNTPPDEGGQNYLHLASQRSANSAHSRTLGSVDSTLSNSSYSSFEIHICCGSPAQARHVRGSPHEPKKNLD